MWRRQLTTYVLKNGHLEHSEINGKIVLRRILCIYVAIGGLVVIELAIGPKVSGFKSGRGRWVSKDDKNGSTTSVGGEVKPSVPCLKVLRNVKDP
jgi:hypothetical protein